MNKKIILLMSIPSIAAIIITSLILAGVLSIKFLSISFICVAIIQVILGYVRKRLKMTYKTNFIIAGILLISGLCCILL